MSANRLSDYRDNLSSEESPSKGNEDHLDGDESPLSDDEDHSGDDEEQQSAWPSSSARGNDAPELVSATLADRLSDDEERQIWNHVFLGLNIVPTDAVHPSISAMPQQHAHLSVGPPEQMVRLPDFPSGRAVWIARDGLRYYVEVEMTGQSWEVRLHPSAASSIEEIVGDEGDIDVWNVITRDQFLQALFPNGVEASGITLPAVSGPSANGNQPSSLGQDATSSSSPVPSMSYQLSSSAIGAQGRVGTRHFNPYSNTFEGGMPVAPMGQHIQAGPQLQRNPIYQRNTGFSETRPVVSQNGPGVGNFGNIITGPPNPSQLDASYSAVEDRHMGLTNAGAGRGLARGVSQFTLPQSGYQIPNASSLSNSVYQGNGSAIEPSPAQNLRGTRPGVYGSTIFGPPSSQHTAASPASHGRPIGTGNADTGGALVRETPQRAHQRVARNRPALAFPQNPPRQVPAVSRFPIQPGGSSPGEGVGAAPAARGGRAQHRGGSGTSREASRGKVTKAPRGGSGKPKGRSKKINYADFKQQRLAALANGTALQTSPAVQNVLDREAPLLPNAPIPDWQQMGDTLRSNFGGRDLRGPPNLSGSGTFEGGNAGANAVRRNATRDGSGGGTGNGAENGEEDDAPDPDEEDAPGEEVSDDE